MAEAFFTITTQGERLRNKETTNANLQKTHRLNHMNNFPKLDPTTTVGTASLTNNNNNHSNSNDNQSDDNFN